MTTLREFRPKQETTEPKLMNPIFKRLGIISGKNNNVIAEIQKGFSVSVIDKMVDELDVKQGSLLKILDVSTATLTRRRQGTKRLSAQESDRVCRVARIYRAAVQLFEGKRDEARFWLNQPAKALNGETPLQHSDTEAGAQEVQNLIGRIEHGVIS